MIDESQPQAAVAAVPKRGFSGEDVPSEAGFNQCVRCGLCLPTCPTYVETLLETSGPRGRIALIKSVSEGHLDITSPGFMHQMSECLDCRACEAVCPSGVPYGQLVETARTQIARATAADRPWTALLLRRFAIRALFGNMALMRAVAGFTRFAQRSGLQRLARESGLLRLLGLEHAESLAPRISDRFFVPRDQRFAAIDDAPPKAHVFLHAGCVMHVAFAEVNEASVRVLQQAGCDVSVPSGQGCCGAITVHAGELAWGRELAQRNIVAFERSGADVYVINAAGCGSALKEYGEYFAQDPAWKERAEAFALKVRDISEFLDEIGISPRLGRIDAVVTYQEPCHLVHAQRIAAAPRNLLARIPGLRLVEMPESSLCCGSAGIYNLTQPAMSAQLRDRKVACALAVAPGLIATANPGCQMQVQAGLKAAGASVPVKHVVQILDEAYRNYEAVIASPSLSAASTEP